MIDGGSGGRRLPARRLRGHRPGGDISSLAGGKFRYHRIGAVRLIDRQDDNLQPVADRAYFQGHVAAGLQIDVGGDLENSLIRLDGDQPILLAPLDGTAKDGAVIEGYKVAGRVGDGGGDGDGTDGALGAG